MLDTGQTARWLAEAWDDYRRTWSVVDDELHDLCARKGHERHDDVYAKVAIINRVYNAGISRSVRGTESGDAELRVSQLLADCHGAFSADLDRIRAFDDLTSDSMATIVAAHGAITQSLARGLDATNLCSFVSKYLHFHCPIVPIYDSRVAETVAEILADVVPKGTRTQRLLERPAVYDPSYYWYAGRFLTLWQLARDAAPDATVKMLDHALWRGVPR